MEYNKAKCGKEFHVLHSCTLPPRYLDALRKGPRIPRLTVAFEEPTIIKDYDCSSLLNGLTESDLQRGEKSRSARSWCIPWTTSYDQNCRLGRATWQWKRLESGENVTGIENHSIQKSLTLTSKSLTKPEPQTPIYKNLMLLLWFWFKPFFIESYCSILVCPSSIGDGVSRLQSELYIYIYVLPILQPTLISYNTVKHIIRICKFVAKQPNEKKIHMKQHTVDPRWLREAKPTSKPHEIHQTTPIGTCSQGREKKQNNLEMACWNHPNLIPHTVLFISILQRFASTCFDIL